MGFWGKINDIVYDITDPVEKGVLALGKWLGKAIVFIFKAIFYLLAAYFAYMILKAIIGFIKYYSKFA